MPQAPVPVPPVPQATQAEGSAEQAVSTEVDAPMRQILSQLRRLEVLVEHVPAVLYIDRPILPGSRLHPTLYVGPQIEAILGVNARQWTDEDDLWQRLMHEDDWPAVSWQYEEWTARGGVLVQEYRMRRPDTGDTIWVRDDCAMLTDPLTGERVVFGVMIDISAQKRLEEQLRTAEARHRVLVEQFPGVVWIESLPGNSDAPFVSPAVDEVFGASPQEWLADAWWERHLHPDDRERVVRARRGAIATGGKLHTEYRIMTDAGREMWIADVSQVVSSNGRPWTVQSILDDVTTRKRAEERLDFRSSHDLLTGLANRALFDQSLVQAIARAHRQGSEVVVLLADVDDFKRVNDDYGHQAGDEVLRIIAARLSQSARASDLVARRGGDEYLVLLTDIATDKPRFQLEGPGGRGDAGATTGSAEDGEDGEDRAAPGSDLVADRIVERVLRSMGAPIVLGDTTLTMSLSIGRAAYPRDANDAQALIAAADAAMYRVKHHMDEVPT